MQWFKQDSGCVMINCGARRFFLDPHYVIQLCIIGCRNQCHKSTWQIVTIRTIPRGSRWCTTEPCNISLRYTSCKCISENQLLQDRSSDQDNLFSNHTSPRLRRRTTSSFRDTSIRLPRATLRSLRGGTELRTWSWSKGLPRGRFNNRGTSIRHVIS